MEEVVKLILVFGAGVFAAFIGAMVGSGGLISIPLLIFLGLPPNVAIATNKLGSLGLTAGAFIKYFKAREVQWNYVIPFALVGLVSAYIGANILVSLDNEVLSKAVGIILLVLLPLVIFGKKVGVHKRNTSKITKSFGFVVYFLVMIWGAFFGGGGGTLVFYTLITFFGFTMIQASATNKIPWFLLGVISLVVFALHGIIDYVYGVALLLGMFVGGYLGARTAIKKGNEWVKMLFVVIVVISSLKMLFF